MLSLSGYVVIGLTLLMLALSSRVLLRRARNDGYWLGRVRYELRLYIDPGFKPREHRQALAQVRRVRRVGIRLTERAHNLTLRRWAAQRTKKMRRVRWTIWLTTLCALALMIEVAIVAGGDRLSTATWRVMGIVTLGLLSIPVEIVLRRNNERWWLHQLGSELVSETHRAEVALRSHTRPRTGIARIRQWWNQWRRQ